MAAAAKTPRLLEARGAITSVGVLLVLGLAAGIYLAWTWVPVYATHYQVVQVVRYFGNLAVKDRDDARLVEAMVAKIRSLEQVSVEGPDGRRQSRPALDVRPQDVRWERVEPASLHVAFDYAREVPFPLVDRRLERVMTVDLTMDISTPRWESSR
jgi:hypothetical protein